MLTHGLSAARFHRFHFAIVALIALSFAGCGPAPLRAPSYDGVEPDVIGGGTEAEPDAPPRRPVLWEVVMGDKASWLFGTVHVGASLEEALPSPYDEQLGYARMVIFETDPSGASEELIERYTALPRNTVQSSMFSNADWSELVFELRSKVNVEALNQSRPWLSLVLLSTTRADELGGGSLDAALLDRANELEKPIRFLETPRQQVELIASVSDETMVSLVQRMIADRERSNAEQRELVELYLRGEVNALTEAVFEPNHVMAHRDYFETMFTLRNDNWLEVLEEEFQEGDAFVAVGAGHLLGGSGLVAQLRERGYELRQVQ